VNTCANDLAALAQKLYLKNALRPQQRAMIVEYANPFLPYGARQVILLMRALFDRVVAEKRRSREEQPHRVLASRTDFQDWSLLCHSDR